MKPLYMLPDEQLMFIRGGKLASVEKVGALPTNGPKNAVNETPAPGA